MKGRKYSRILLYQCEDPERADLIEGPKDIIDHIRMYKQPFYDDMEKNYDGDWADYDWTEGFVEYLNTNLLAGTYMKVKIIARSIPNEAGCYPTEML